jgi:hypothetical protein
MIQQGDGTFARREKLGLCVRLPDIKWHDVRIGVQILWLEIGSKIRSATASL